MPMPHRPGEDPDFDKLMKKFMERLMRDMDDGMPASDCPEDFDRAIPITDGEAILSMQLLQDCRTELERFQRQLSLFFHRSEIARGQLFERLEKVYPNIRFPDRKSIGEETANTGFRFWQGQPWYVGHDRVGKDKDGKTAQERGEAPAKEQDLPPTPSPEPQVPPDEPQASS